MALRRMYQSEIYPAFGLFGALGGVFYGLNFHRGLINKNELRITHTEKFIYYGTRVSMALGFGFIGHFMAPISLPYILIRKTWNCSSPYFNNLFIRRDWFLDSEPSEYFPYMKKWLP